MKPRAIVVVITVVLLAVVAAVRFLQPRPAGSAPAAVLASDEASAQTTERGPAAIEEASTIAVDAPREPVALEAQDSLEADARAAGEAPVETSVLVEGTIIVLDPDDQDREITTASGSFEPVFWESTRGSHGERVEVEQGRFRVRVPLGKSLGLMRLELDGRIASPELERHAIESGVPLLVRAHFASTLTLHVVDAVTLAELTDVTVVGTNDFRMERAGHPGDYSDDAAYASHARSPLRIGARTNGPWVKWKQTLFVGAAGYAWKTTKVDFHLGGEATVELERGGELAVTLQGVIPPLAESSGASSDDDAGAVLRVRRATAEPFTDVDATVKRALRWFDGATDAQKREAFPDGRIPTEAELREQITAQLAEQSEEIESSRMEAQVTIAPGEVKRIQGLEAGPVVVTLERGEHFDKPMVLARESAEIAVGNATFVTLVVAAPKERRLVPLSGTVHFSPDWGSERVDLRFEPVGVEGGTSVDEFELDFDDLEPVVGTPGRFRFDAGRVLPGRWLVKSYAYEFQQIVDTGPDGTESAQIAIGDPADVFVHLLDEATGQPMRGERLLLWNCKRPRESTGGGLDDADWNESAQAWVLRAPAGEIELMISFEHAGDLEPLDPGVVTVRPGRNEFTYQVRHATGVLLSLSVDGKALDHSSGLSVWETKLVAIDGSHPDAYPASSGDRGIQFRVPAAGRWRVELPSFEGFEPVEPVELTLEQGVVLKHEIALQRRSR